MYNSALKLVPLGSQAEEGGHVGNIETSIDCEGIGIPAGGPSLRPTMTWYLGMPTISNSVIPASV